MQVYFFKLLNLHIANILLLMKESVMAKSLYAIFIALLLFPFFPVCAKTSSQSSSSVLKINIISLNNGVGLETDQKIIKKALERLGHSVECFSYWYKPKKNKIPKADINIFFEALRPEKFSWAEINWFVPNPEWYGQDLKLLDELDLILCRTKEVKRIFKNLNKKTYFLGFTSPDCLLMDIKKDYSLLAHLAGASIQKGTETISQIWENNAQLPHLTLLYFKNVEKANIQQCQNLTWISTRLPEKDFRTLQNSYGIQLCPSETEGFGHYLSEAMSVGAVVLTTDAPPMNEFIRDPRCLVPYTHSAPKKLGVNYYVDPIELENKIQALVNLPLKELEAIGRNNRINYLKNRVDFHERLDVLMKKTIKKKKL